MTREELRTVQRKMKILEHANQSKNISLTCRYFGITRETFYQWKRNFAAKGEQGLINSKPGMKVDQHPKKIKGELVEKIIYLRTTYHFGPQRIAWFLQRYMGIVLTEAGIYYALKRKGLNRLPHNCKKRSVKTQFIRYEKKIPGHHVQVDVKFLSFVDGNGQKIKRFQYTAIDDATRIRALKIYSKHTQANAIDFVNYVIEKFPFRIHTIRTDNGHEYQALFHWHVEDRGIQHIYIKPGTPRLNSKVERSHRTDQEEFYQLLNYTDDINLKEKLTEWENYYNYHRPHGAFKGQTPFEILQPKLQC